VATLRMTVAADTWRRDRSTPGPRTRSGSAAAAPAPGSASVTRRRGNALQRSRPPVPPVGTTRRSTDTTHDRAAALREAVGTGTRMPTAPSSSDAWSLVTIRSGPPWRPWAGWPARSIGTPRSQGSVETTYMRPRRRATVTSSSARAVAPRHPARSGHVRAHRSRPRIGSGHRRASRTQRVPGGGGHVPQRPHRPVHLPGQPQAGCRRLSCPRNMRDVAGRCRVTDWHLWA
jgi:hypothetical protein